MDFQLHIFSVHFELNVQVSIYIFTRSKLGICFNQYFMQQINFILIYTFPQHFFIYIYFILYVLFYI